jgi:hypothetical protein
MRTQFPFQPAIYVFRASHLLKFKTLLQFPSTVAFHFGLEGCAKSGADAVCANTVAGNSDGC